MKYFLTQTVYVDAPAVPTAVAETQTLKVIYSTAEIQTLVVRTQSASMLTEPEPEIEQADVMLQTEAGRTDAGCRCKYPDHKCNNNRERCADRKNGND